MDKRNDVVDKYYKNTDCKVKDRGDLKKLAHKMLKRSEGNTQMGLKIAFPELGDSERQLLIDQTMEKLTINTDVKKPINEVSKLKKTTSAACEKKNFDKDEFDKSYTELRKRIRDKYTLKLNSNRNKSEDWGMQANKKDDSTKVAACRTDDRKPSPVERSKKQLAEETTQTKDKVNYSPDPSIRADQGKIPERIPTKSDKITPKLDKNARNPKRKPMVQTITSKTGKLRVFKAVTFVESTSPTPLEIKIPNEEVKKIQKVSKYTETTSRGLGNLINPNPPLLLSKVIAEKEKLAAVRKKVERKREKRFRDLSAKRYLEALSPPTEVARWAPESIDHHTKPYYEAWVDTTLAAISKHSQRETLSSNIMRNFQRIFSERPASPELLYANYNDERYTGRIKVTKR